MKQYKLLSEKVRNLFILDTGWLKDRFIHSENITLCLQHFKNIYLE